MLTFTIEAKGGKLWKSPDFCRRLNDGINYTVREEPEMRHLFIDNQLAFSECKKVVDSFFNLNKEFPDQVFKKNNLNYLFSEFDLVLSEDGWESIEKLAIMANDQSILLAMVDDLEFSKKFFLKHHYFHWAKIPVNFSKDDYWKVLKETFGLQEGEDIETLANKIVILPDSFSWMIYGERETELSVLGFCPSINFEDDDWLPLGTDVFEKASVAFPRQTIPEKFIENMMRNYKSHISR